MEREIKHLNDLLDQALKEKEEAEIKIEKAIDYIKSFEYYIPEDNVPELLEILGDKENE